MHEKYGFLLGPDEEEEPCQRLTLAPFEREWEQRLDDMQALMLAGLWRPLCRDHLPILDVTPLFDPSTAAGFARPAVLKRAFVVLTLMSHGYVWGLPCENVMSHLPKSLAEPWIAVAEHLGLRPVLCHAAVVLYNWRKLKLPWMDASSLPSLENLAISNTVSGTRDEAWFYLITVAVECHGGAILHCLLAIQDAVRDSDKKSCSEHLHSLCGLLEKLCAIMPRMFERCDAYIFYNVVRPYLTGWSVDDTATTQRRDSISPLVDGPPANVSSEHPQRTLPHGLWYGDETAPRQHAGGSAAQSALIAALDVVLGVSHYPTLHNETTNTDNKQPFHTHDLHSPILTPKSVHSNNPTTQTNRSHPEHFLDRMRGYMPLGHRTFLQILAERASLRVFIQQHHLSCPELTNAYNGCLTHLRRFRDLHLQLVAVYIVSAGSKQKEDSGSKSVRGTGGTALMPFLKQVRDETTNASLV